MKIIAVAGLAFAPAFAFGQTDTNTAVPLQVADAQLGPVLVTATRTPLNQADALSQTIVVDRSQIEQAQAADIGQILQQYAGIDIARSGGLGQPASLFIRGGNANYTLVMIDGVRVNDGVNGESLIQYINPEVIERIELVEGPLSTLYGSDAVSGVINIITRKPGPNQLDLEAGGGSFNTVHGGGALRGQGTLDGHAWGAALAVQQLHSAGIPIFAGSDQGGQYRNLTYTGNAGIELGGVKLEARAWDSHGESPYLNPAFDCLGANPVSGYADCDEKFRERVFALHAGAQLTQIWYSELNLSRSENRLSLPTAASLFRTVRPEADWHNVLTPDQHNRVSFGVRARRERNDSPGSIAVSKDDDYAYLQEEANYGRHHAVADLNYLHDGIFGERLDWNTQYGFDLFRRTRLIAGVGTAFHTPTALDLYYPGFSNPALLPEKSLDYELALKQRFGGHQEAELRAFRNEVRNLITLSGFGPVNVGRARLEGLQLKWSYSDGPWNARLDGVAQNPREQDPPRAELPQRARLSLGAALNRQLGRYDLGAAFHSAGRRADSIFNYSTFSSAPTTDGGYGLLDLSAGVRLTQSLRFDLLGRNVLNHHYQTVASYNQPGSAVYATLRYALPL